MRRSGQKSPPGLFRGPELMRLCAGLAMLAVLYLLIVRAGDADVWRWLTGEDAAPALSHIAQSASNAPDEATDPIDADPDQAEAAREEFLAVTDGTLKLQPEEMEPYDRLVAWVKNQSFAQLANRARSDLLFTNFHDEPQQYRGQRVVLDLNVRRILDAGTNRDGVPLHEVWGFSNESRDRLYVAIVVGLPKTMPVGPSVAEKARFAGYFFKLQGYHAVGAKPGDPPDRAPLLIGRLEWQPAAAPPIDRTQEWIFGLILFVLIAAGFGFSWVYRRWIRPSPPARSKTVDPGSGEVIPIEEWLDRADFGSADQLDDEKAADR